MIIIIDNGSQYTHLIKRNCRDLGKDAEIINNKKKYSEVEDKIKNAEKIIISGGPSSVYASDLGVSGELLKRYKEKTIDKPLLGICFGHQMITHIFGGKVEKGKSAEYGITRITVDSEDAILKGMPKEFDAWASHFDEVRELPEDFIGIASSNLCKYEVFMHKNRKIFGVQFHPEVWHTENGEKILKNFLEL